MKDLSYHILDIVQNSLNAGAQRVEIDLWEETPTGRLTLKINDNGRGMDADMLKRITDPFFTTSVKKKVGLGLPLLKQNAELTGGSCSVESESGQGTRVTAIFNRNHIDMIPTGDLAITLKTLIASSHERDFLFTCRRDEEGFEVNTAEIRSQLEGVSLASREVLDYISTFIRDNLKSMT
ncbi:MAG: ATP-binding protein [Bacteroidales bacterium]|nr:ATP-binding protein [Bacteroidales bacterium]